MTDAKKMLLTDQTPEADAAQQRFTTDIDDETGLNNAYLDTMTERDANQTDLTDQATNISASEPL